MLTTGSIEDLEARVGQEIGVSGWREVTQDDVDRFAAVTGNDRWTQSYLTLSLAPVLLAEMLSPEALRRALNHGLDRVRFPAPMPVGGRLRMRARLVNAQRVAGGVQMKLELVFESEGITKPTCVAQSLLRFLTPTTS